MRPKEQKHFECGASPRLMPRRFCAGLRLRTDGALAAISANSYAIVNNVAHISKLTATSHPCPVAVDARRRSRSSPACLIPPFHLHPLSYFYHHNFHPSFFLFLLLSATTLFTSLLFCSKSSEPCYVHDSFSLPETSLSISSSFFFYLFLSFFLFPLFLSLTDSTLPRLPTALMVGQIKDTIPRFH